MGSLRNQSLKYLFADSYEVNSAIWTPLLPEEFEKRSGYRLLKYLPLLDGYKLSADTTTRFLFDFRKTLSDLIIENHYALGKKLCEEQGLGFVAEAGGPGQPIHNVPFEDLKALGALTVPRGEFWNKHPQLEALQIVKGIASASHIYNQKFVEAESFTSVWLWQEGPNELKPLADRAMCEGLNRFVYHTFPHTPPESGYPGWVYNFGTLINTTNGWWPKSKGFHDYLARSSFLLQQGTFVGDVAYYYGDEAPNFVPPKKVDVSLGLGYDYDVVNTDVLVNKMQVRKGKIVLPHGQSYEVLVLPKKVRMNIAVAKKLMEMVAAGATVIGPKPERSYGLGNALKNDSIIQAIARKVWGANEDLRIHRYGNGKVMWNKSIRDVLLEKGINPDLQYKTGNTADTLDYIHRHTSDAEIYFVRNTKPYAINAFITFRIKEVPEIWEAETGSILSISTYRATAGGTEIPISLSANGSVFVVFHHGRAFDKQPLIDKEWLSNNAQLFYTTNGAFQIHQSAATMVLDGPWELRFEQNGYAPARDTFQTLIPLNQSVKDGVRYFSGTVAYHHSFYMGAAQLEKGQRILLDLGKVKEIADVYLNGKSLATSWHAPFRVDITDAIQHGQNKLVVEVVNTPNNALIGDAKLSPNHPRLKSNITKLPNAWSKPFAEAPLIDAGLIGPVNIIFAEPLLPEREK